MSRGVKASSQPVCHRVLHSLDISFDIHLGLISHCLELPCWLRHLALSWYLHKPESHQLSLNIGLQVYLSPIKMIDWFRFNVNQKAWLLTTAGSSQEYGKHIRSLVLSNGQANPGACHFALPSTPPPSPAHTVS